MISLAYVSRLWFVKKKNELQSDENTAFRLSNFPPPTLRRDIGMLGFLHKRVLGLAHPAIERLFPWAPNQYHSGHTKQLDDRMLECNFRRVLFLRSLFGLTAVYNLLPQYVVDCSTVSQFQKELTKSRRDIVQMV